MTEPASHGVAFEHVRKAYGGALALDDFSLDVAPGELVALLGPSGCGKTTALRCLAGLEHPNSGRILIDDTSVGSVPIPKRDIGMVFQAYSLFPHMTALQNVEYGLRMRKVPSDERRRRALDSLDLVGLGGMSERYASELSGGQQQRVALSRALVTRPRVLLLDEPLSALDAKVRAGLRDEIRLIQKELSITTLLVTHDQEEALAVADRVAVMRDGAIEQIGTPETIYRSPATTFVADFVGVSNALRSTAAGGLVRLLGTEVPIIGAADGPVDAFCRPEHLRFVETGGVAGSVLSSSFLGSFRRTRVELEDGVAVVVQHEAGDELMMGASVRLTATREPVRVRSAVEARDATK